MDIFKSLIPRKLTRKEAKKITSEIVKSRIDDPNARVTLAILKAIEVTNKPAATGSGK